MTPRKRNQTETGFEVKTFPVPFALRESQENITINTNTPSKPPKPSKEQIINQGLKFYSEGKLEKAKEYYNYFISRGLNDYRILTNYGLILRDLGNLKESELTLSKAIKLKPDLIEAHYNLGITLSELKKSKDALNSYLRAIEINPKIDYIYHAILLLLGESDPSKFNKKKLKRILAFLLKRNDISHIKLFNTFNYLYRNILLNNIESLFNNEIIIDALKKIVLKDSKVETILAKVRKDLCLEIAKKGHNINSSKLLFIIALAEQCFLNEYIYSLTEDEKNSINTIINHCSDGEISEINIAILSCYFPIYKLINQIPSIISFNSSNPYFKELIRIQLLEPLEEIELSKNINKLGLINDQASQKVKSQYEENPYPRWRSQNTFTKLKVSYIQEINTDVRPNSIKYNFEPEHPKILIAGCGTGSQILQAKRFYNAEITGIDLSLSSLSYAQRKINELEIENVDLFQMDILEVGLLEKKFDIIECIGVLHHMRDPSQGLKALLAVLKDSGFLKLGLYSQLSRSDIHQAREYIANQKLEATIDDIRHFRQNVISSNIEKIKNLQNWGDFYTTSECRDLCFHEQEHTFTIQHLQEILISNKIKFLGFALHESIKSLYKKYFPEDITQTNLQNWAKFEKNHPSTFRNMYVFWGYKINN